MAHQNKKLELTILHTSMEDRLANVLDTLDQLHTAASDGYWPQMACLDRRELVALLREIAFTAEETIQEIAQEPGTVPLRVLERSLHLVGKRQA